jgi:hypothetical protein
MALALLDGTSAAVNIAINTNSYNCIFSYVSADISRQFNEYTTFCSTGWRSRVPGMKQITGRLDGFLSTGANISDPSQYFASQVASNFVLTFTINCTYTFTGWVGKPHSGIRAAANSELSLDYESNDAPTFAWQVT